ncbi:MAG: translation initiation factor IF-2 N-terminal domain-containing protein, partial [Gemmataceae bacterium]|nr:translation initiation factor IF-2 N-terminal domain-containing protein [Gemmataceae bacterium]
MQQKEKKRVYTLARELGVDLKDILLYCKELGYEGIKNQLSSLDPEQCDRLRERIERGSKAAASPASSPVRPVITHQSLETLTKVRTLPSRKKVESPATPAGTAAAVPSASVPSAGAPVEEVAPETAAIEEVVEFAPAEPVAEPAAAADAPPATVVESPAPAEPKAEATPTTETRAAPPVSPPKPPPTAAASSPSSTPAPAPTAPSLSLIHI